ncbi:MAG: alpha/beta fold hydrolase [Labilithrix sp.]|nr:alpha/beta fold hydrolase [Labilithrix sp.]
MSRDARFQGVPRSGDNDDAGELPSSFDGLELAGLAGRGGMGSVYAAHDVVLDRRVAVKFVDVARDADARAHVVNEARMLARLSHPNVVAIYRVGEVEGRPYIAYEYIDGTPLDALDVPLAPAAALGVAVGLARGLAAVHARGILHRDVKPANAILAASGEVKLLDFGIAQARGSVQSAHDWPLLGRASTSSGGAAPLATWERGATEALADAPERSRTRLGVVLGTPRYLAPERWDDAPASVASDVFAFGVVLYELVAGRLGQDGLPSLAREGLPPLQARVPGIPEGLAALVDACVAPDPSERPGSMTIVRDRLEAMTADGGDAAAGAAAAGDDEAPDIRYARAGDINVAYSVIGSGRQAIVAVPAFVTNLDATWAWPELSSFYRALGEGRRVVAYDKRGTGLSDRSQGIGGLEARLADLRAVMDAAGVERATLFGASEGVPAAIAWSVLYPERTEALVLYGGSARGSWSPDFPAGPSAETYQAVFDLIDQGWGQPILLEIEAPSVAEDEAFRKRWANFLRVSGSPGTAKEVLAISRDLDVAHLLASVRVPTLVVHREGDRLVPVEAARLLAARIPGAELVLLPGEDHVPMVGDVASLIGAIRRFLDRAHGATSLPAARIGTFVVFELAGGLSAEARETWRQHCVRARAATLDERDGVPTALSLQGLLGGLTFARDLVEAMRSCGVAVRAGVVTGDIDGREGDGAAASVSAARTLAASAPVGEVRLSRGLAGLLAGTGVELEAATGDGVRVRA